MAKRLLLASILCAFFVCVISESITWVGGAEGIWDDPNSWSNSQIPTAKDDVIISNATVGVRNATLTAHSVTLQQNSSLSLPSNVTLNFDATSWMIYDTSGLLIAQPLTISSLLLADSAGIYSNASNLLTITRNLTSIPPNPLKSEFMDLSTVPVLLHGAAQLTGLVVFTNITSNASITVGATWTNFTWISVDHLNMFGSGVFRVVGYSELRIFSDIQASNDAKLVSDSPLMYFQLDCSSNEADGCLVDQWTFNGDVTFDGSGRIDLPSCTFGGAVTLTAPTALSFELLASSAPIFLNNLIVNGVIVTSNVTSPEKLELVTSNFSCSSGDLTFFNVVHANSSSFFNNCTTNDLKLSGDVSFFDGSKLKTNTAHVSITDAQVSVVDANLFATTFTVSSSLLDIAQGFAHLVNISAVNITLEEVSVVFESNFFSHVFQCNATDFVAKNTSFEFDFTERDLNFTRFDLNTANPPEFSYCSVSIFDPVTDLRSELLGKDFVLMKFPEQAIASLLNISLNETQDWSDIATLSLDVSETNVTVHVVALPTAPPNITSTAPHTTSPQHHPVPMWAIIVAVIGGVLVLAAGILAAWLICCKRSNEYERLPQ